MSLLPLLALAALVLPVSAEVDAFTENVTIQRLLVEVRAVAPDGTPRLGLGPDDFRVEVEGRPVEDLSVDWFGPPAPAAVPVSPGSAATAPGPTTAGAAPGRLIVLFFQRDLERSRATGLQKMAILLRDMLAGLAPDDRVAVLSFDSRLDLHLDFTADREILAQIIKGAGAPISRPAGPMPPQPAPSLGASFDYAAARSAATIEDALVVTARALDALPGPKTMFFCAYGMGRLTIAGAYLGPTFHEAIRRLQAAHVSVFTFDVVDADWHSLEGPLRSIAQATGGLYQKVDTGAREHLARAERAISGYYVLSFRAPDLPPGHHPIQVRLVSARRADDILVRTYWDN